MKSTRERIFALITVLAVVLALGICPIAGAQDTSSGFEPDYDQTEFDSLDSDAVLLAGTAAPVSDEETLEAETVELFSGEAVSANDSADVVSLEDTSAETEKIAADEVYTGNKIGQWLDKTFTSFDYAIFTFFGNLHHNILTVVFNIYTHLGDTEFAIPMLLLGAILCLFKKTRKVGMTLCFAVVIGTVFTNVCLKNICGRARPYVTLSADDRFMTWYREAGANIESDNSFPSGHTTCAFEIATALFATIKNKKIKWIFPVYAILIAASRLYLMVHYPTDVLAGVIVGICAGLIAFVLTKALMKTKFIGNFDVKEFFSKKKA